MYDWDDEKDRAKQQQFGYGFAEVLVVFDGPYYQESRESQYVAIGFGKGGDLVTVVFEDRLTNGGIEYIRLVTFWKSSPSERKKYAAAQRKHKS